MVRKVYTAKGVNLVVVVVVEIVQQTGDPDVNVVIVDYSSSDIDMEAILKKSSIPRYTVVTVPAQESFQRAMSLQRGADVIKDPHSILFMCDLHLKIPSNLISTIRKVRFAGSVNK